MFRPTSPQHSLFESRLLVPAAKRVRLEKSWAHVFLTKVLPLIDEELYRDAFDPETGRPNRSIRLLTGVHLLKEWYDLTDEETLEQLEYNIQWQYALGVTPEQAHLPRKTLHNHRVRTLQDDRAQKMFERVTRGLVEVDGLSVSRQRLDSTHVISNMAVLTRLGLLVETLTKFFKELKLEAPEKLAGLGRRLRARYLDREGYFADVKKEQARRRLPVVAQDLQTVVLAFADDEQVRALESYGLVVRVFEEQVEVIEETVDVPKDGGEDDAAGGLEVAASQAGAESADEDEDAGGSTAPQMSPTGASDEQAEPESTEEDGGVSAANGDGPEAAGSDASGATAQRATPAVRLKEGKQVGGDSLQSPHDPDATYGRKGKGYEVQIAETCVPENPYQVVTHIDINGAHESDQHATSKVIGALHATELAPDELLADTGYGSGENIVDAAVNGVDLQAPVQDPNAPKKRDTFIEPVAMGELSPPLTDPPLGLGDFSFNRTFDEVLSCPGGFEPTSHEVDEQRREPYKATFDAAQCAGCPLLGRCPTRQLKGSSNRILRWRDSKAATATRQREQREAAFKENYKARSGIESTNEELKSRHGVRNLRVRGRARVKMCMFFKAKALNAKRACQAGVRALRAPPALPAPA